MKRSESGLSFNFLVPIRLSLRKPRHLRIATTKQLGESKPQGRISKIIEFS
jgi:hypothetical protein